MREYVERTLHVEVETQHPDSAARLPLYLRGQYGLERWTIFGMSFIMAKPKESLAVKTLEKHHKAFEDAFGLPVAFAYDDATDYRVCHMIEANLPFVVADRQVYLPFLGVALSGKTGIGKRHRAEAAEKVSPQTQRFALRAICDGLDDVSVTQAAKLMCIAKMTASRVFDELESVEPSLIVMEGRQRKFRLVGGKRALWQHLEPRLQNPVVREHRLGSIPEGAFALGGMSALCERSMLQDNPWPTYAVTKAQEREMGLRLGSGSVEWDQWEEPTCVVQVMRYEPDLMDGHAIDPLSAILSLPEEERQDPRVEGEIEKIMERVFADEHAGD